MKAIILAAGRGSRMQQLTDARPKCLVELCGRPLLARQIEALRAGGATEVGIVRGYRAELLDDYGDRHFDNPRWAETNMVMSLACAAEWLRTESCIVSYSDIFYAAAAVAALGADKSDLAITCDRNWLKLWQMRFADPLSDAETFRTDALGRVVEVGDRPRSLEEVEGQYMGLLRFTPTAWEAAERYFATLPAERRDRLDMTSLLRGLIGTGFAVTAVDNMWPWGEVDHAGDLACYENDATYREFLTRPMACPA